MTESALFEPLPLGRRVAPNRIVHAAMSTKMVRDGVMDPAFVAYHARRAQGGVGVIVTEALSVCPTTAAPNRIQVRDPRNRPLLDELAAGVHRAGGLILGQLWHNGNARHDGRATEALGISARPDDFSLTVARVMTETELDAMVGRFADAAATVQAVGFDGVELAGAHGFLIHQTLSPHTNDRRDAYGGTRLGRTAFTRRIIAAIRARCGDDFILGLKLCCEEAIAGGLDLTEAEAICHLVTERAPPDYFCFSKGSHSLSLHMHLPSIGEREAGFADAARRLRASVGDIPIIAVGKLIEPDEAARLVGEGAADAVALGRALVADPDWPNKARAARSDSITPCIACNLCWGAINRGRTLACAVNPDVLAAPASAPVSSEAVPVDIAGSGVAAMEAAWRLAARGHEVRLIAHGDVLGGALALLAGVTRTDELARYLAYLNRQLERHRVAIVADDARPIAGVVRVNAAGATMPAPAGLTGRSMGIRDALRRVGDGNWRGGHAVLYDNDHTEGTYLAAAFVARRFERLTIVTPRPAIATDVNALNAQKIHRWSQTGGHRIVPFHELADIEDGRPLIRNVHTGAATALEVADVVVHAMPRIQNAPPAGWSAADHVIGDAAAPRDLMAAVADAGRLCRTLAQAGDRADAA